MKTSASKKPKIASDEPLKLNNDEPVLYIECCRS